MRDNTLHHAFPIVAAAIGNRFGIQVKIGGDQAYTDGKLIQLPAYNGNDPDYQDYAWGLLAHEAAHLRYSDFTLAYGPSVLRRRLCGAIEDVRIEYELAKDFPGTRLTLRTVIEKMIASGGFVAAREEDHPANVLYGYVLKSLRARVLGQTALNPLVEISEQVLKSHFPTGAVIRLKGLLSEVPDSLTSESDCLHLADRILILIEQECENLAQEDTQQQQSQASQGDTDADTEESISKGDTEPDDGHDHSIANTGDAEPSAESSGPGETTDSDGTAGNDLMPSQMSGKELAGQENGTDYQSLMAILQSASEADFDRDVFDVVKSALALDDRDAPETVMPVGLKPLGNAAAGLSLINQVQSESVKIRAALQGWVQSQSLARSHPVGRGRRVIGRRLPQLALGDPRVFARRVVKPAPNTAIHLLLDKSDSMDEPVLGDKHQSVANRLSIALEASMALALAFEGIAGVNSGITAFPGRDDTSVFRLLEHGERIRAHSAGFSLRAGGTTPMTEAVWFAAAALLRCREPRKVLLVMTDGQPNDILSTLEILQRCRNSGIETVGVGLGLDVGHLFPAAIMISELRELRTQLFALSKAVLLAAA
jgi:cobaltochelatase CobT